MSQAIGIDLGTTNSVVAVLSNGASEVIVNSEGAKTTPSVVLYPDDPDSDPVVGEMARRQVALSPHRAIRSVKRLMGARFDEARPVIEHCGYKVVAGGDGAAVVEIGGRTIRPEDVSAQILHRMVQTAEDFLDEEVDRAVVTVPAYFNDSQRTATKRAGELAGLEVIRIINEPTAACLAYGLKRGANERVAVFDFGGGTFDISIVEIDDDVFEVKATNGDTFLGGDNIDEALTDYFCEAIAREFGVDPRETPEAFQRVREAAEKAKCELSSMTETTVSLPFIVADDSGPKHFNRPLSRETFEALIDPILKRIEEPCRQAISDAKIALGDLSTVLLVGGSTRIPAVRRLVAELFRREPSHAVNPDEAVALGAAIQAGVLTGELQEVLLLDVTPLSLGIELEGGIFSPLIPRNSSIPTSAAKTFTTVRDNQAAVSVHVLQGERRMARENRTLARLRLTGIDPAPREIPQIEVSFDIDANGILNVSAQDLSSGVRQEVTVESFQDVTEEEMERRVQEAEEEVEADRHFLMLTRARVRAGRSAEAARAFLARSKDELSLEDDKTIRERILRLDMAVSGSDISAIDQAERDLRDLQEKFDDLVFLDRLL